MENDLQFLYGLRKNFIVVGLTGRLGSGCTSTAELLAKADFDACNFPHPLNGGSPTNEQRKYRIAHNFLKTNWSPFQLIRASDVITAFLLTKDLDDIASFLCSKYENRKKEIDEIIERVRSQFVRCASEARNLFSQSEIPGGRLVIGEEVAYKCFVSEKTIVTFSDNLKKELQQLNITDGYHPYQWFGDNLRMTGDPLSNSSDHFNTSNSYIIAEVIRQLIKVIRTRNNDGTRIVIDSIRNSMEARYFKERYSAFYLFAINTEEGDRISRQHTHYNSLNIKALDQEYTKNLSTKERFYKQDIQTCIQASDVYIANPTDSKEGGDEFKTLKESLLRYLSLILQPGIITPTPEERCMQIAYTAKYNSGCISRQVGAVVTDSSFSLKAIGWNNTAEGQTPCLLRNVDDLIQNSDSEAFSQFEKEEGDYKELIRKTFPIEKRASLNGRNLSFCFKDGKNCIDGNKNQVHTRSLHAEENAMLQVSKYGGEGLKNGFLFTTASPCELCSKKAYQLGIKRIFYIDPYPGISNAQILRSGEKNHRPETFLFVGAVGRAYHHLFEPFIAFKDELEILLKFDYKASFLKVQSTK